MRRYLQLIVVLALLLPVVAKAQSRGRNGRDNRSERIAQVIRDCEQRTNEFLKAVEGAWGRERHTSDELDRTASKLERTLNRVRDSWNRDHDYGRTRGNIGAALDAGRDVNRTLSRHRLNQRVSREWGAIRTELDNLAEVFEQPRIRW
jgi:DNA repair ATPase RecN